MQMRAVELADGTRLERLHALVNLPASWLTGGRPKLYVLSPGARYNLEEVEELATHYNGTIYIRIAGTAWYPVNLADLFIEQEQQL